MDSGRWRQVAHIYDSTLEREPADRAAFLAEATAGDDELRREIESLLTQEQAPVLIDQPLLMVAGAVWESDATLEPETQLGPYRIKRLLGAGGMGEVYRAYDTKLQREVALKILPDSFVHDPDRLARFTREAHVLASLNHPNIAAIYGIEDSGGVHALVLELVDGPTLADRIADGPLPRDEALAIARQIAEALETAHEHGVIHRDLKPANIKVRDDGTVKVLDFGLAKPAAARRPTTVVETGIQAGLSQSPTIMSPAVTSMGVILGTAAYMSPEQAKGRAADKRSDIWAFGCVLYEMLTGRRAFDGEDVSDTLAGVLRGAPDWNALPTNTPTALTLLLKRCLEKDGRQRIADVAAVRFVLNERVLLDHSFGGEAEKALVDRLRRRERWILASALLSVIATGSVLGAILLRPEAPAPEMRLEITTPPTADPSSFAISPDGQKIVFAARSDEGSRLWLRPLNSSASRPLPGTEDGLNPFWSPDSRSVGFSANGELKRIDIGGGSPRIVTSVRGARGATWSADGTILFAAGAQSPIFRIAAEGGAASAVTRLESGHIGHRLPQFLPDGRHFLYYVTGSPDARGVYVGAIDRSVMRRLLDADNPAVMASTGQLLFVRQGTLWAQDFDQRQLTLQGSPFPVAERVAANIALGSAVLSASAAGLVAYRTASPAGVRQLVWFDRAGQRIGSVGEADAVGPGASASLSPDGRRVALQRPVGGNLDVWLLELARGVFTRLTFDAADDVRPIWSPDGTRIVFASTRNAGTTDLYQKSAAGSADEALLLSTAQIKTATDWSADGRFLLYNSIDPKTSVDIWALPMDGSRKSFPLIRTAFNERNGQFSSDSKWVAYQSNESGRYEIYVRSFVDPEIKSVVSINGGIQPRWQRDGRELFYVAPDGRLMGVGVAPGGHTVEAGAPAALLGTQRVSADPESGPQYTVSPDGQRFLVNTVTDEASVSPITVILNWKGNQ